jgi:ParB-like chromosome segregation protein Spo0J
MSKVIGAAQAQGAKASPPERSPWRNRIVGHAEVEPQTLVANPQNWRLHPESQRRTLRAVLDSIGWVGQVIVNRVTGHIVDGHLRVEEAIARGEPTVPVELVELSLDEERQVLATLDPIGGLALADPTALAELLASFSTSEADLAAFLDGLAATHGARPLDLVDPDDVPAPPEEAATYVRSGQLWELGSHRLLCGDALDPAVVARLLDGARPRLMTTDQPYGVSLDLARRHALSDARRRGGGPPRGTGHRNVSLAGDERADWSEAFALVPSLDVVYVWRPALHAAEVAEGLARIGFELVSEIVWVKSRWAVGRRWYHWRHETCLVARRRGARVPFLGGRDQGTTWAAPSPKVGGRDADPKADHPAQKPVLLFDRPIRNHLHPGEAVYDPFLGSGTTLIAAELSHRRCYGLEIDPRYAQVAIERWQAVTGGRAVLADGEG